MGWQWRWIKLIEAAIECGGLEVGSHCALSNARMTLDVLCYLQRRTNGCKSTTWPAGRSSLDTAKANSIFHIAKIKHLMSIESISQYQ
ncbi:hypothetical protein ACIQYF_14245 [Pseudomonas sp. NPDC096917]|uniref:hypothetical protein n=1 Tax=Pseudomonas sp. NPDC096917 TaxID=3364483 RepID=UPI00383A4DF9